MSDKTPWTPGPWHVGVRQAEQIVYNTQGWAVANATVYHGEHDLAEVKANARLIALAPEMAEALQELMQLEGLNAEGRFCPSHWKRPIFKAVAVLAKLPVSP